MNSVGLMTNRIRSTHIEMKAHTFSQNVIAFGFECVGRDGNVTVNGRPENIAYMWNML